MQDFLTWLKESEQSYPPLGEPTDIKPRAPMPGETPYPGSNDVIQTGKQPQVGANNANDDFLSKNITNDNILAVDGQIKSMENLISNISKTHDNPNWNVLRQSFSQFLNSWDKIRQANQNVLKTSGNGLANVSPSQEELEMRKLMQPPPQQLSPNELPGVSPGANYGG